MDQFFLQYSNDNKKNTFNNGVSNGPVLKTLCINKAWLDKKKIWSVLAKESTVKLKQNLFITHVTYCPLMDEFFVFSGEWKVKIPCSRNSGSWRWIQELGWNRSEETTTTGSYFAGFKIIPTDLDSFRSALEVFVTVVVFVMNISIGDVLLAWI